MAFFGGVGSGVEKLRCEIFEPLPRHPGMENLSLKTPFGIMVAMITDFGNDRFRARAIPRLPDEFKVRIKVMPGETPAPAPHRQKPGRQAGQQHRFFEIFLGNSEFVTTSLPKILLNFGGHNAWPE